MRGKVILWDSFAAVSGITPAYAGKSSTSIRFGQYKKDHPRVCGEKQWLCRFLLRLLGSPPRMRGKAAGDDDRFFKFGITPAYAGKSSSPFSFFAHT